MKKISRENAVAPGVESFEASSWNFKVFSIWKPTLLALWGVVGDIVNFKTYKIIKMIARHSNPANPHQMRMEHIDSSSNKAPIIARLPPSICNSSPPPAIAGATCYHPPPPETAPSTSDCSSPPETARINLQ